MQVSKRPNLVAAGVLVFCLSVWGVSLVAAAKTAHIYTHRSPAGFRHDLVGHARAHWIAVKQTVERVGYCTVVVSEGVQDAQGKFLAEAGTADAFGHTQLGGAAPFIAQMVKEKLGYKFHWAVPDYLQRSARHLASKSDAEQAYAVGKAAVEYALAGKTGVMPVIKRTANTPFKWKIVEVPITQVANIEKKLPANYISSDGFSITPAARRYFEPLIRGEDTPPYDAISGLPKYAKLKRKLVRKKLPAYSIADK